MTKDITIVNFVYDVYNTTITAKNSRLAAVEQALRQAINTYYSSNNYVIFTGPEYMFARKNYTNSALNTDAFRAIDPTLGADDATQMEEDAATRAKVGYTDAEKKDIINRIAAMTKGFPRLLVLPGTILWREHLTMKKMFRRVAPMHNTLPIICDGEVIHTYNKKCDSDELKAEYRLRPARGVTPGYGDHQQARYRFAPGTASGKFRVWDMDMAVEICADHSGTTVKNELGANETVDIHFLISASMTPTKRGSVAGNGGLMVNNDGSLGGPAQGVKAVTVDANSGLRTWQDSPEAGSVSGDFRVWKIDYAGLS